MKPGFLLTFLLAGSIIVHASSQTSITLGNKLRSKRSQNELTESSETICARFTVPFDNQTFFSPIDTTMLTDNYPPKISCTLKLQAPVGHIIKLDFRNRFNIEPSPTCEYDYLEIRDGQYGFSKSKGKFCGNKFPDEIISSDRYLWLRFRSDDNIEYEGFEGVYEYLPRKTETIEECSFKTDNPVSGKIQKDNINDTFINQIFESGGVVLDCLWMIEVKPDWQIMLSVEKFNLEKKNDCDNNFVDIIGNDTNVSEPTKHFCGVVAEAHESKSNILFVRFFATKQGLKSDFSLLYTAFTKKKVHDGKNSSQPRCADDEFDCDDETCIDLSLKCNDQVNCKFRRDEAGCEQTQGEAKDLWLIIAVFSALLGAMTSVFLFNCIRTLIRDQKIIRETIRQSKESKLDEAGRMSIKRSLENVNRIIPGATGYAIEPRLKQIQDEDAGHIFREATSASSISDSINRINKNQYNYRDELKKILRNPPPEAFNNNEHAEQYVNEGVCDMACQTRESLFASGISSSTKLPPSNTQAPGTYKFSTFGYNPLDDDVVIGVQEIPMQSTYDHRRDASITPNRFESTSPGVVYTYEHPHKYDVHTPSPAPSSTTSNLRTFGSGPKKNAIKMEQSQLMLEIRNSAPDVIIMTSH